nr:hypothetical protein [Pseudomonas syringae]
MRGGGIMDTALRKGLYQVYRPKDKNIGDWAAQSAMSWASERKIPYNAIKSAKSVTRFSNFGPLAIASAKKYSQDAFESNPKWGKTARSVLILYLLLIRQPPKTWELL